MGPIAKSRVSLRVVGENLSEEAINAAMGCKATEFLVGGDSGTGETGMRCRWLLHAPETLSLEEQIAWLLENTNPVVESWNRLAGKPRMDVFCGLFLVQDNEAFELDSELLSQIAERKWTIGFDIYSP